MLNKRIIDEPEKIKMTHKIELVTNEIVNDSPVTNRASDWLFTNTKACSYLPFITDPNTIEMDVKTANIPNSEGEYNRVKIGDNSKGISCDKNDPLKRVKTFL